MKGAPSLPNTSTSAPNFFANHRPMIIRHAVPADIPALLRLLEALFGIEADFYFDAEKSRRGLELMLEAPQQRTVLVAVVKGEVAGMCAAQLVISTAMGAPAMWVEDVVMQPQFRGQGVMPTMLAELEKWGAERGATRFQLLCDSQNAPAMAFYPKQGFKPTQLRCFHKYPES